MRSRWLIAMAGTGLVITACARGSTLTGVGGGTDTTVTTTTSATTSSTTSATTSTTSGPACSETPCKVTAPQCGCAAGEACSIDPAKHAVACIDEGTVGGGQACNGAADCAAGFVCVQISTAASACSKFCDSDADCAAPGGLCIIQLNDGKGGSIPNVTLCTDNCDVTTNAGCVPGAGCQLGREQTGQMRWLTFCGGTGTKGKNQVCDPMLEECLPGFGCFSTGTSDICLQYCNVNGSTCPNFGACSPLQDQSGSSIFIGSIQVGVCG